MTPPDPVPPTAFTAAQLREQAASAKRSDYQLWAKMLTYAAGLREQVATLQAEQARLKAQSKQSDETMLAVARNLDRVSKAAMATQRDLTDQLEAARAEQARLTQGLAEARDHVDQRREDVREFQDQWLKQKRRADTAEAERDAAHRRRDEAREALNNTCACAHDGRGNLTAECQEHQEQRERLEAGEGQIAAIHKWANTCIDGVEDYERGLAAAQEAVLAILDAPPAPRPSRTTEEPIHTGIWFVQRQHPDRAGMIQLRGPFTENEADATLTSWKNTGASLNPYKWERIDPPSGEPSHTTAGTAGDFRLKRSPIEQERVPSPASEGTEP